MNACEVVDDGRSTRYAVSYRSDLLAHRGLRRIFSFPPETASPFPDEFTHHMQASVTFDFEIYAVSVQALRQVRHIGEKLVVFFVKEYIDDCPASVD